RAAAPFACGPSTVRPTTRARNRTRLQPGLVPHSASSVGGRGRASAASVPRKARAWGTVAALALPRPPLPFLVARPSVLAPCPSSLGPRLSGLPNSLVSGAGGIFGRGSERYNRERSRPIPPGQVKESDAHDRHGPARLPVARLGRPARARVPRAE